MSKCNASPLARRWACLDARDGERGRKRQSQAGAVAEREQRLPASPFSGGADRLLRGAWLPLTGVATTSDSSDRAARPRSPPAAARGPPCLPAASEARSATMAALEASLALLAAYRPTAPQRAAAVAFMRAEAEAIASRKKSKCFLLLPPDEGERKAGPGRIVFREPSQKHHLVIEPDGAKTKGLALPPGAAVRVATAHADRRPRAASRPPARRVLCSTVHRWPGRRRP